MISRCNIFEQELKFSSIFFVMNVSSLTDQANVRIPRDSLMQNSVISPRAQQVSNPASLVTTDVTSELMPDSTQHTPDIFASPRHCLITGKDKG